jgi:hypothetical protein
MAEIVGIHSGGTVSLIIGMACIFAIVAGLIYADGSAKRYIGKFRTRFRIGHILERFSVGPDGRRPGPALRACANSMRAAEGARHEVEFRRRWRERSGRPQPSKRELSASKRAEPISCSNVADERNFSASATEAKCAIGQVRDLSAIPWPEQETRCPAPGFLILLPIRQSIPCKKNPSAREAI